MEIQVVRYKGLLKMGKEVELLSSAGNYSRFRGCYPRHSGQARPYNAFPAAEPSSHLERVRSCSTIPVPNSVNKEVLLNIVNTTTATSSGDAGQQPELACEECRRRKARCD